SPTPERSRPWMTAARMAGSGDLRKRSTSGRFARIIAVRSRLVRQGLHQVQADLAGQFGRGAFLAVLLRRDGGVGLVGGGVGGGHRLLAGERLAAVDGGQRPAGPYGQFVAGGGVVDAAAERAARLLDEG